MATTETAWPSAEFPADVKALLDRFFALVESQDENVGSILADEVFTPTGMTQSGLQKFEGREEIIASRIDAWKFITSRKHTIFAVFDGNLATPGRDIMMQATVELGLKSGTTLDQQFAARAVVVDWEGAVRLQSFVVWTDSAPLRAALMPPQAAK